MLIFCSSVFCFLFQSIKASAFVYNRTWQLSARNKCLFIDLKDYCCLISDYKQNYWGEGVKTLVCFIFFNFFSLTLTSPLVAPWYLNPSGWHLGGFPCLTVFHLLKKRKTNRLFSNSVCIFLYSLATRTISLTINSCFLTVLLHSGGGVSWFASFPLTTIT